MKKLLFICSLFLLLGMSMKAQNQKTLLLECFTESGCGPCASQNPAIDALLEANQDVMVAVKYHVSWPSGTDPMYHHNTADNGARTNYYGVNAVPHEVLCGNLVNGAMPTQAQINNFAAQESPINLSSYCELNSNQDSIFVYVMGNVSSPISGSLKLQVAVIEKLVQFTSAPGPNGERTFRYVMKKMLPSASGTHLGSELIANDYFAYRFAWALANVYDNNQLSVVAWVQNNDDKTVYQACKHSDSFQPFYAKEAGVSDITHAKSLVCSGSMNPDFVMTNFGSETITSATIEAVVNGEVVKTFDWTGNLESLKVAAINIGEINYAVEDDNELIIRIVNVNGADDEYIANNSVSYEFEKSPENVAKTLKLTIRTDNQPQETTWEVKRMSNNEVVLSGGPYSDANTMYNETFDLPGDDCYEFTIYDAGGNGLNNGGIYGLKAGSTTLFSGNSFTDKEINEFSYEENMGINENESETISIYPNPAENMIYVDVEDIEYQIYNITGAKVQSGIVKNGNINISSLNEGVYMIKIANTVHKLMIVR